MRIRLIAVGSKMPAWVEDGCSEYLRRLPPECSLELVEIPAERRGKGADTARIAAREGERMLAAVPRGSRVVALDVGGRQWSTEELSVQLRSWMQDGRDVALLVGGPEGLAPACREAAEQKWSLSRLTFPHPLVRIVVAEQVYRAWSILANHPYHK